MKNNALPIRSNAPILVFARTWSIVRQVTLVCLLATFAFCCSAQRVYDSSELQIARVEAKSYYDASGHQIGRVDGGHIYDGWGRQLGRIDGERLYSSSGSQMGRIDGERIYDAAGQQIGRMDGLRRMQGVVFFYFFM